MNPSTHQQTEEASATSNEQVCVICQTAITERVITEERQYVRDNKLSLVQQLQYSTDSSQKQLEVVSLSCSHIFHRQCIVKWIHFDNSTCPLCRQIIQLPGLEKITWKLNNIAVRTRCSPESLRLGLRPEGWFNVQLQIVPPENKKIRKIRYVFHPAFSLNKLDIIQPPYDLVMKLVSNSVVVVIEVTLDDKKVFSFVHQLSKDMCARTYYEDMYNGSDDSTQIQALQYFGGYLEQYKRDGDYYVKEMPPPPRFQNRNPDNQEKPGFFQRLFGNLFQG